MIDLILDVEQDDCPFVATTEEHPVAFSASDWSLAPGGGEMETRMTVEASDPGTLTGSLGTLRDREGVRELRLHSKSGSTAEVEARVEESAAMAAVRDNGGYVTGPFHVEEGSRLWHVGFDTTAEADEGLAALRRDNVVTVESREHVADTAVRGMLHNADAAASILDGCRSLTDVERDTLRTAVEEGYFDTPRGITLGELADRFDVSKPAASKNLRRGQRKLLERAVDAIGDLESFP